MWRKIEKKSDVFFQKKYETFQKKLEGTVCTVIKCRRYVHGRSISGMIQDYIVTKCSAAELALF